MCVGILFFLGGIFIWASIALHWEWVTEHYKVKRVFRLLGEKWATLLYAIMGLAFVIVGILMATGMIQFE